MTDEKPGFFDRISTRAAKNYPSEVNKLFAAAGIPGIISFAGGAPHLGELPFEELSTWARDVLTTQGETALQYTSSQGLPEIREQITNVMRVEGIEADPDDVVVTAGSQLGLDLVTKAMCNPGDVVVAEAPSYAGGLGVLAGYETDIRTANCDAHGVIPAEVDAAITTAENEGKPVKFVYSIPSFQNPSNTTLPSDRRAELIDVCRRHDVLLVEDNPYGLLGFDGPPQRALKADNPDGVLYLGTFSKIFGPGLRIGWMVPPPELTGLLTAFNEIAMLHAPSFNQLLLARYIRDYDWQGKLAETREIYRAKCRRMLGALEAHMPPGTTWNEPEGGFYIWLTLPEGLNADRIAFECVPRGLTFVSGTAFNVEGGERQVRLSYCLAEPDQIDKGISILATVIGEHLESAGDLAAAGKR